MRALFYLVVTLMMVACKENGSKKTVSEKMSAGAQDTLRRYRETAIGWTTQWPEDWEVQSTEQIDANTARGKKAVEATLEKEVDVSTLKNLLHLKKDRTNSFISTLEPYNTVLAGDYQANNQRVYQIVKDTYAANHLKATYTEDSTMIDGLRFSIFRITIYKPNSDEVLMWQDMYSRLINGYDFGATLSYDNKENRAALEKMLFGSRFTYRD